MSNHHLVAIVSELYKCMYVYEFILYIFFTVQNTKV